MLQPQLFINSSSGQNFGTGINTFPTDVRIQTHQNGNQKLSISPPLLNNEAPSTTVKTSDRDAAIAVAVMYITRYLEYRVPRRRVIVFGEELSASLGRRLALEMPELENPRTLTIRISGNSPAPPGGVDYAMLSAISSSGLDMQEIFTLLPDSLEIVFENIVTELNLWVREGPIGSRIQPKLLRSSNPNSNVHSLPILDAPEMPIRQQHACNMEVRREQPSNINFHLQALASSIPSAHTANMLISQQRQIRVEPPLVDQSAPGALTTQQTYMPVSDPVTRAHVQVQGSGPHLSHSNLAFVNRAASYMPNLPPSKSPEASSQMASSMGSGAVLKSEPEKDAPSIDSMNKELEQLFNISRDFQTPEQSNFYLSSTSMTTSSNMGHSNSNQIPSSDFAKISLAIQSPTENQMNSMLGNGSERANGLLQGSTQPKANPPIDPSRSAFAKVVNAREFTPQIRGPIAEAGFSGMAGPPNPLGMPAGVHSLPPVSGQVRNVSLSSASIIGTKHLQTQASAPADPNAPPFVPQSGLTINQFAHTKFGSTKMRSLPRKLNNVPPSFGSNAFPNPNASAFSSFNQAQFGGFQNSNTGSAMPLASTWPAAMSAGSMNPSLKEAEQFSPGKYAQGVEVSTGYSSLANAINAPEFVPSKDERTATLFANMAESLRESLPASNLNPHPTGSGLIAHAWNEVPATPRATLFEKIAAPLPNSPSVNANLAQSTLTPSPLTHMHARTVPITPEVRSAIPNVGLSSGKGQSAPGSSADWASPFVAVNAPEGGTALQESTGNIAGMSMHSPNAVNTLATATSFNSNTGTPPVHTLYTASEFAATKFGSSKARSQSKRLANVSRVLAAAPQPQPQAAAAQMLEAAAYGSANLDANQAFAQPGAVAPENATLCPKENQLVGPLISSMPLPERASEFASNMPPSLTHSQSHVPILFDEPLSLPDDLYRSAPPSLLTLPPLPDAPVNNSAHGTSPLFRLSSLTETGSNSESSSGSSNLGLGLGLGYGDLDFNALSSSFTRELNRDLFPSFALPDSPTTREPDKEFGIGSLGMGGLSSASRLGEWLVGPPTSFGFSGSSGKLEAEPPVSNLLDPFNSILPPRAPEAGAPAAVSRTLSDSIPPGPPLIPLAPAFHAAPEPLFDLAKIPVSEQSSHNGD